MTAAEVKSMIEAAVMKFVGNAEAAPVAVAAPAIPASVGKRTLSEEQKRKMAEGRERARAAKAGKKGRKASPAAVATPVAVVEKPAKAATKPTWEVKPHTTKRGETGVVVSIYPLSAFLKKGDAAKKKALFDAINAIRTDAAHQIAAEVSRLLG